MDDHPRTILVVDDEAAQRRLLGGFLESRGFRAAGGGLRRGGAGDRPRNPPDMVLLDVRLPGMSGIEALAEIRKLAERLPVLLITAYADLRQAVSAMKSGADDYLTKPLDLDELEAAIVDALGPPEPGIEGAADGPDRGQAELPPGLVCESPAMRRAVETVRVVAPSNAAGLDPRAKRGGQGGRGPADPPVEPAVRWAAGAANCAGLPESLIESELFGHTKGAFTGAVEARQGYFRAADGGTLFLDEIGELPLRLQPKLLRALESGEITPVGSDEPLEVDVRLVAATNRDLAEAVRQGKFREDLYYRINVVELIVPPLCERYDDILPLAVQFAGELAGTPVRLSPQAVQCLLAYPWPGNVRELRNAIHRACLLCRGDVILPEHLPPKMAALAGTAAEAGYPLGAPAGRLSQVERATILATLAECSGNRTHAAKKLGISRRTLIYRLRAIEAKRER